MLGDNFPETKKDTSQSFKKNILKRAKEKLVNLSRLCSLVNVNIIIFLILTNAP